MNRVGHTLSGVAAGLWTLPVAPVAGPAAVAWVGVVSGYALAPDMDHPASTSARMWGPVSQGPARVVGAVVGHRGATHTVFAAGVAGVVVWAATTGAAVHAVGPQAATVAYVAVVAVTFGLAFAACRMPWAVNLPVSWGLAAATYQAGLPLGWLPWAATLGVAAHLAGDAITRQGIPNPFGRGRVGPRLITTGSAAETVVCIFLAAAIAAYPLRGHLAAVIERATA